MEQKTIKWPKGDWDPDDLETTLDNMIIEGMIIDCVVILTTFRCSLIARTTSALIVYREDKL